MLYEGGARRSTHILLLVIYNFFKFTLMYYTLLISLYNLYQPQKSCSMEKQEHDSPLKGKFRRRTDHKGPQGEGLSYSCTFSLTSALDGGGWSAPRLRRFTP
jgi:hypothetical protein